MTKLDFGFNRGLPDGVRAAWGARWIVTQDGYVDQVPDRQDAFGEQADKDEVFAWLNGEVGLKPRETASEMLRSGLIHTRREAAVTLYQDERGKVVANTNASAGYLYVAAFLFDHVPDKTTSSLAWDAPERAAGDRPLWGKGYGPNGSCCVHVLMSREPTEDEKRKVEPLVLEHGGWVACNHDWEEADTFQFSWDFTSEVAARMVERVCGVVFVGATVWLSEMEREPLPEEAAG